MDSFPLPRIDDLFASLAGGKAFSKLDLPHAYQQLQLDDESKKAGGHQHPEGSVPLQPTAVWCISRTCKLQRTIQGILQGIPNVCVYLDDILITGHNEKDHLNNLDAVLTRLDGAGMRLKQKKCAFMLPAVEYLGHHISEEGLRPTQEKVCAGTSTTECHTTTRIFGPRELLWKICTTII